MCYGRRGRGRVLLLDGRREGEGGLDPEGAQGREKARRFLASELGRQSSVEIW